jgi:hypothetical protein
VSEDKFGERAICAHCGTIIVRDSAEFTWKHYPTLRKWCGPTPTATPSKSNILENQQP